jgi:hypothetical protein
LLLLVEMPEEPVKPEPVLLPAVDVDEAELPVGTDELEPAALGEPAECVALAPELDADEEPTTAEEEEPVTVVPETPELGIELDEAPLTLALEDAWPPKEVLTAVPEAALERVDEPDLTGVLEGLGMPEGVPDATGDAEGIELLEGNGAPEVTGELEATGVLEATWELDGVPEATGELESTRLEGILEVTGVVEATWELDAVAEAI